MPFKQVGTTQYTPQFVPIPLDFIQNQLDKKQAYLDAIKGDIGTTSQQLVVNADNIDYFKQMAGSIQDEYTSSIDKIQNELLMYGDTGKIAGDLQKLKSKWVSDKDRLFLEHQKDQYDAYLKGVSSVKDYREYLDNRLLYEEQVNKYYKGKEVNRSGLNKQHQYNYTGIEEGVDWVDDATMTIAADGGGGEGYRYDEETGTVYTSGGTWERITPEKVLELSKLYSEAFLKSQAGRQLAQKVRYENRDLSPEKLNEKIYTEAVNYIYEVNADQIFNKETSKSGISFDATARGRYFDKLDAEAEKQTYNLPGSMDLQTSDDYYTTTEENGKVTVTPKSEILETGWWTKLLGGAGQVGSWAPGLGMVANIVSLISTGKDIATYTGYGINMTDEERNENRKNLIKDAENSITYKINPFAKQIVGWSKSLWTTENGYAKNEEITINAENPITYSLLSKIENEKDNKYDELVQKNNDGSYTVKAQDLYKIQTDENNLKFANELITKPFEIKYTSPGSKAIDAKNADYGLYDLNARLQNIKDEEVAGNIVQAYLEERFPGGATDFILLDKNNLPILKGDDRYKESLGKIKSISFSGTAEDNNYYGPGSEILSYKIDDENTGYIVKRGSIQQQRNKYNSWVMNSPTFKKSGYYEMCIFYDDFARQTENGKDINKTTFDENTPKYIVKPIKYNDNGDVTQVEFSIKWPGRNPKTMEWGDGTNILTNEQQSEWFKQTMNEFINK